MAPNLSLKKLATALGLATTGKSQSGLATDIATRVNRSPVLLQPSGDTTGDADTLALNTAANVDGAHLFLAAGQWYVHNVGLTTSNVWLQGSGNGTVVNVLSAQTGIVVTGPGNLVVSDLLLKNGGYGIYVNGAYDAIFRNLTLAGQTLGGVKINGDAATEQNWTDITMRGVGGIAFDLQRTTTIYTGSIYLDRVRTVEPAAGATGGFRFTSTAGSASLNIAFMNQCVADNYTTDAYYSNNCAQVFVSGSWFAINASGSGAAAMRINGGFQHSYTNNYTYSGLTSPTVVLSGGAKGVTMDGHVFDGIPTGTALGLAGVAVGGFKLGTYSNYCPTLTDTPLALLPAQPALPGYTGAPGEETFSRLFCNSTPALTPGTLYLTYFTAAKTEVISTIECMVNNAASGATYAGMGLYTVSAAGLLTLVAKGEATTLFTSGFQPVGGFNTKIGFAGPATYTKTAGQRYAVGVLTVGGTGPNLIGVNASSGTPQSNLGIAGSPLGPLSATKTGQTTLGTVGTTTHTLASLSGFGGVPYFVLA